MFSLLFFKLSHSGINLGQHKIDNQDRTEGGGPTGPQPEAQNQKGVKSPQVEMACNYKKKPPKCRQKLVSSSERYKDLKTILQPKRWNNPLEA